MELTTDNHSSTATLSSRETPESQPVKVAFHREKTANDSQPLFFLALPEETSSQAFRACLDTLSPTGTIYFTDFSFLNASVQDLAAAFLNALSALPHADKIVLIGYTSAGNVVQEILVRLQACGSEIQGLGIIIDAFAPECQRFNRLEMSEAAWVSWFAKDLYAEKRSIDPEQTEEWLPWNLYAHLETQPAMLSVLHHRALQTGLVDRATTLEQLTDKFSRHRRLRLDSYRRWQNYHPPVLNGSLYLLTTSIREPRDEQGAWRPWVTDLHIQHLHDCTHFGIFTDPAQSRRLSEQLNEIIQPHTDRSRAAKRICSPTGRHNDMVIYHILPDRFNAQSSLNTSNKEQGRLNFHGGRIKHITAKMDYFKKLGVNALWLSPLYLQRGENGTHLQAPHYLERYPGRRDTSRLAKEPYHGYAPWDLKKIDPRFGTWEDYLELIATAHRHGIKIIQDIVINHLGQGFPGLPEEGLGDYRCAETFHQAGILECHSDLGDTDWEDPYKREHYDVMGLLDLRQENETVSAYIINSMLYWLEKSKEADGIGIDGLRLDAVKHVGKVWLEERLLPAVPSDVFMLGEIFDGAAEVCASYQKSGFDAVYDFPLMFAIRETLTQKKPARLIHEAFSADWRYRNPDQLVTMIDNHDVTRFRELLTAEHFEEWEQLKATNTALTIIMTFRGIPCVYYGTELGMSGDSVTGRHNLKNFNPAGYSLHHKLQFSAVQHLISIRKRLRVLRHGHTTFVVHDDEHIAAWVRHLRGELPVLVIVNTGRYRTAPGQPFALPIPSAILAEAGLGEDALWTDILDGTRYTPRLGALHLDLDGISARLLLPAGRPDIPETDFCG